MLSERVFKPAPTSRVFVQGIVYSNRGIGRNQPKRAIHGLEDAVGHRIDVNGVAARVTCGIQQFRIEAVGTRAQQTGQCFMAVQPARLKIDRFATWLNRNGHWWGKLQISSECGDDHISHLDRLVLEQATVERTHHNALFVAVLLD